VSSPPAFDVGCRPLPAGRVVLEASAGTGKTYAIVGLATRYLAEGTATADQLLVLTFARSATRELRHRLLDRVARGLDVVTAALDGRPVGPDAVDRALVDGADDAELRRRADRLARALADVDEAAVTTIHGFCADALRRIGDDALGALLDDERGAAAEVAGDLYLRRALEDPRGADDLPWFPWQGVDVATAGAALRDPAAVHPDPRGGGRSAARAWLAAEAQREAAARRRRLRRHTYDDLVTRLADRLEDPLHGAAAVTACGGRFAVALVDEFQDTDPAQWRILSALFADALAGGGERALVLVGDPKQAVYAFRGADVHAYTAVRGAAPDATLPVNHRADQPVVEGVAALFAGRSLGHGIDVHPVRAHHPSRLVGLPGPPVHVRVLDDDAPVRRALDGTPLLGALRDVVARDVARQAVHLLHAGARVQGAAGDRPLGPADLAVLVRTNRQAATVQRHLVAAGVPSVLNGVGSVLSSPAVRDWLALLAALDRPSRSGLARLAALGDLVGWSAAEVVAADEDRWDDLHVALHRWRDVLAARGVAAAVRHVAADTGLHARLLSRPDGRRRLTDLVHVGELLHARGQAERLGVNGLRAWLRQAAAAAAAGPEPAPDHPAARRLERGDDAVQILTVHGAKGLEFGVVLAPYLWDVPGGEPTTRDVHDPSDGRRRLAVGCDERDEDQRRFRDLHLQQREEEERRLAYVAVTRAVHHLRLWWAPSDRVATSALGTLLAETGGQVASSEDAHVALEAVARRSGGTVGRSEVDVEAPVGVLADAVPEGDVVLARFDRTIDHGWRRTSYSRIVGAATAVGDTGPAAADDLDTPDAGPAPAGPAADQPAGVDVRPPPHPDARLAVPLPLGRLRGGADVGTVVHAVLERVDFAAADVRDRLREALGEQAALHGLELRFDAGPDAGGRTGTAADPEGVLDAVADGLLAALATPLGAGDAPRLQDLRLADRVDELPFEIPALRDDLAEQAGRLLVGDVADLLDAHLPADDLLRGYPALLRRDLADVEVRGFLAGFVDLLARLPDGRFLVADYKTNRVAPPDVEVPTAGHLAPAAMAEEMLAGHYPLQALIYLVAVHRYLRWRLAGYDPDRRLAGVAYLFLRGMAGPSTPEVAGMRCGVFRWRPPTALLLALDRLLAEGVDRGVRP
jgi:exodeoxyribonuclease V beta subunit